MSNRSPDLEYIAENELIARRLEKAENLREEGVDPYYNRFSVSHSTADVFKGFARLDQEQLEQDPVEVSVAGRLRFHRRMGKASFLKIQDWSTQPGSKPAGIKEDGEEVPASDDFLQIFVKSNEVGERAYGLSDALDLGDFIGVKGHLMRTKTGELTVRASELFILTKSIRPLPDKWHGLTDIESRFRQRYVDLAINPDASRILRIRSKVIQLTRQFFYERGYLEVETPVLHPTPGGAAARPFKTHHNTLDLPLFMRIAPELYLKRLLVGGLGRVFELGRVFRNEGISRRHNPEFTMLEFYQAYATYTDLFEVTESLFSMLAKEITGDTKITYDGNEIELSPPWRRVTVMDAVKQETGVDIHGLDDRDSLIRLAGELKIPEKEKLSNSKLLMEIFDLVVEPTLVQPTFVTQYPREVSPLSRENDADPQFTDRFELFVAGHELANAFSELNDPVEQYRRFSEQMRAIASGDEEAHPMDSDYVRALEYGMPPAAGEGIGIDRLVMLIADTPNIREVIGFPLMRPDVKEGVSED